MRVMGLDFGSKTVGVAISDPLGLTAQGIETITRKQENKLRKTLARIEALIEEYGVERLVLGFPKHMNNDEGERARKSLEFAEILKRRTNLEVVMWDERLTTVEAERTLMETGGISMEKISFEIEDTGDAVEFFVLEQTAVNGETYLLVADSQDGDAECLILKDTSEKDAQDSVYEIVEDDTELQAVSKVFEELLEDVDIEM